MVVLQFGFDDFVAERVESADFDSGLFDAIFKLGDNFVGKSNDENLVGRDFEGVGEVI